MEGLQKTLRRMERSRSQVHIRYARPCSRASEVPEINREDLYRTEDDETTVGEGTFGTCSVKTYRGIPVAVKSFKIASMKKDSAFIIITLHLR